MTAAQEVEGGRESKWESPNLVCGGVEGGGEREGRREEVVG